MSEDQAIKVTREELESRQVRLVVSVSEERIQSAMQKTARRISRNTSFPGFRKGKVPYDMVVQRFGEMTIREEAADALVEEIYPEVLELEGIKPYAPASLEDIQLEPLQYTFTISLRPVVELGKYTSLRVKQPKVNVKKGEVNDALEALREEHAILEPAAEDQGAAEGDGLVISVQAFSDEGQLFLSDEDAEVVLRQEAENPVPGFYRELIGMKVDEERAFRLQMPDERPSAEAEFKVKLVKLFDRALPGLDDDLARTVGDFDSLKELRKNIEERIREYKQAEADEEYTDEVVSALIEMSKIEYPPEALEAEVSDLYGQLERRVQREQRMDMETYLKAISKTEDEIRDEFRPAAEERLRRGLVLSEFILAEELTASDEEIEQRVGDLSAQWGIKAEEARQQLLSQEGRQAIMNDLLVTKALERLTAIGRGEADTG